MHHCVSAPCQQALWPVAWLSLRVQHCWYRAQEPELMTADVECTFGLRAGSAPAVRLLFACLTPLSVDSPLRPDSYSDFVRALDGRVRQQITITNVLDFVRAALEVPPGVDLLLLLLIDEGNAAKGVFAHDDLNAQVCGPDSTRGSVALLRNLKRATMVLHVSMASVLSFLAEVQTLV